MRQSAREHKVYVLVVDDDESVHEVTDICLSDKVVHGASVDLISAYSKEEAIQIIKAREHDIRVALVDVVMETETSGLELVEYIRKNGDKHVRVIVRTGQAGLHTEEEILRKYDIDQYICKTDITPEQLWSSVRIGIKYSYDLQTLSKFVDFISEIVDKSEDYTKLKEQTSLICQHLSDKYNIKIVFELSEFEKNAQHDGLLEGIKIDVTDSIESISAFCETIDGSVLQSRFLFDISQIYASEQKQVEDDVQYVLKKVLIGIRAIDQKSYEDKKKLIERTQELAEKERLEMIARMTSGIAHEINTPIGVANTAATFLRNRFQKMDGGVDQRISRSVELIIKNIKRASQLIQSFKKLSASSLSEHFGVVDLIEVINDCSELMHPELKSQKNVDIRLNATKGETFKWNGFSGSLSQVIINFFQNVLRYAYEADDDFIIDINVYQNSDFFVVEFQDHGKGIPADVRGKVFQPFVTTGRGKGGTGLGLAICHNLVVNQFKGSIVCESELGRGAKFTFTLSKHLVNPDLERLRKMSSSAKRTS